MVGPGILGSQQQEHQIDRRLVDGIEIHRLVETREHAVEAVQFGQLAMRDRDAAADAGGAKALTLQQDIENRPLVQAGRLRRAFRQLLQALFLAGRMQRVDHAIMRQEIGYIHLYLVTG